MLKILSTKVHANKYDIDGTSLLRLDPSFTFLVEAPLYWWIDFDGVKFGFELDEFSDFERQNIPLSTNVKAYVHLSYEDIVTLCTDYVYGLYDYEAHTYQWNNEREWKDFCETLLDVQGIRDLVKEKI